MEQIAIFDVLRWHLCLIVLLSLVAAFAGYGSSYLMTERYLASVLVLLRPQQPIQIDERNINKNLYDFPVAQSMSVETPGKTYIEIIKSESLIGKVVQGLDVEGENDKTRAVFLSKFLPAYLNDEVVQFKKDLVQFYKDVG